MSCGFRIPPGQLQYGFVYVETANPVSGFRPESTLRTGSAADIHHIETVCGQAALPDKPENVIASGTEALPVFFGLALLSIMRYEFVMAGMVPSFLRLHNRYPHSAEAILLRSHFARVQPQ